MDVVQGGYIVVISSLEGGLHVVFAFGDVLRILTM